MAYLISYTSRETNRNTALTARVRDFKAWAILNDNTFFVDDDQLTPTQVFDKIKSCCSEDDRVLIFTVKRPGCATNISASLDRWIVDHIVKGDNTSSTDSAKTTNE